MPLLKTEGFDLIKFKNYFGQNKSVLGIGSFVVISLYFLTIHILVAFSLIGKRKCQSCQCTSNFVKSSCLPLNLLQGSE